MPFRPLEKFADINPVAASGRASADLPAQGTYHSIWLNCLDGGTEVSVANIKDNITDLRITHDGVNIWEADAHLLYDLYEMYYADKGAAQNAGMLPIVVAPEYMVDQPAADRLAHGMGGVGVLQLEMEFSANVGTANHTDQIQVYVDRRKATRPLGTHKRLNRFVRSSASAGVQEITDLPHEKSDAGIATTAYHIVHNGATAVVNNVEVLLNNETVINAAPRLLQNQMEMSGRKWMADTAAKSVFTIPFDLSNDVNGFMSHRNVFDVRLKVDWSAAPGSFEIYRESIHGIGQEN